MTIAELRKELGQTLEEFAVTLGLKGKSSASEIESTNRCSLNVALILERLSAYRIDAAALNDDVAASRAPRLIDDAA